MNTQHLDLLTKACDEIVAAKEAIANAESKIAYIREQIQNTATNKSQDREFELGELNSDTFDDGGVRKFAHTYQNPQNKQISQIPQPRVSRVKEILERGKKVTNEGDALKFEDIPNNKITKFSDIPQNLRDITISSLEIAELTGKQHIHIMRDIRDILGELGDVSKFGYIYKDTYGREQNCYQLPKREDLILVSGYNVKLRAKIIDRLEYLENQILDKMLSQTPQQQSINETLKRYEALFGGKFSVQTPCKQFIEGITKSYTPNTKEATIDNGVKTFSNEELGSVRTILKEAEPLFCLSDICKVLELTSPHKVKDAIVAEFEGAELNSYPLETAGGKQNFTFINEPELYFVLMRSDKPKAKPFRQWVVNEVLPSIRKSGSYQINAPQQQSINESLKRYEALFGGKFSVQTPCKQFIIQNIAKAEAKHNAIATELVSYNYTEEFKKGKAKISSRIGLVYDRPVPIDKKPIITKGYLPNEMLRENQEAQSTANAESKTKVRKR